VDQLTTAQIKEETEYSSRAKDVGAPATLKVLPAPTRKEEMMVSL
jgi:hypothetical protein